MARAFDRDEFLAAFDEIGLAAIAANTRIDIAVFDGSALMLASNFRFSTEDVDIAEIVRPWPDWLSAVVARIGERNGWLEDWFNDAVDTFLSPARAAAAGSHRMGHISANRRQKRAAGVRANRALSACLEAQGLTCCQ